MVVWAGDPPSPILELDPEILKELVSVVFVCVCDYIFKYLCVYMCVFIGLNNYIYNRKQK